MLCKAVCYNTLCQKDFAHGDFILVQGICFLMCPGVDINCIVNVCNNTRNGLGAQLYQIVLAYLKGIIVHPQQ